jgi:hypothetical protein
LNGFHRRVGNRADLKHGGRPRRASSGHQLLRLNTHPRHALGISPDDTRESDPSTPGSSLESGFCAYTSDGDVPVAIDINTLGEFKPENTRVTTPANIAPVGAERIAMVMAAPRPE